MSENTAALTITVYDRDLIRKGWVSNPVSVTVVERWLAQGNAEITVEATDPILEYLMAPGARVVIHYQFGSPGSFRVGRGSQILSGMVRDPRGSFLPGGTVTVQAQDDWRYLRNLHAYVIPPNPGGGSASGNVKATGLDDWAQSWADPTEGIATGTVRGLVGRYQWPTTPTVWPAESAVDYFLNVHLRDRWRQEFGDHNPPGALFRFGGATDQGRGVNVRPMLPQVRFDTLESVIVPWLEASNLGFKFSQLAGNVAEGLRGTNIWEMWEPKTWPQVFTPDSGIIREGDWALGYPNAMSAIVGGPGEEAARAFRRVDDATGLADQYEDLIDVFRDATGAPVYWPETVTDEETKVAMYYHLISAVPADRRASFEAFLLSAGADALAEGAPTAGVSLELAESDGFRYGGGSGTFFGDPLPDSGQQFRTGDVITVSPSRETALAGLRFTDRITSTTVTLTRENGIVVTPQLGQKKDDPNVQLALAVRDLAAANRVRSTSH